MSALCLVCGAKGGGALGDAGGGQGGGGNQLAGVHKDKPCLAVECAQSVAMPKSGSTS